MYVVLLFSYVVLLFSRTTLLLMYVVLARCMPVVDSLFFWYCIVFGRVYVVSCMVYIDIIKVSFGKIAPAKIMCLVSRCEWFLILIFFWKYIHPPARE